MLKRLFPSMFDGDFDPKRLCLMWPVDCYIYAWCFSLCAYGALALEALLLTLVIRCCRFCFVVITITPHNVLQNEPHAPAHERLLDDICCCCSHVVIVVAIAQRDMIVSCACAQGLVVRWRFMRRDMKLQGLVVVNVVGRDIENGVRLRTRPCRHHHHATRCENASVDMKLKLCACAWWLMHSLRFGAYVLAEKACALAHDGFGSCACTEGVDCCWIVITS